MLNLINSAILGIVEGLTEFLPVSSTAHLILASDLLHAQHGDFIKTFEIVIQFGAILSVIVLYWRTLFKIETIKKLIIAFLPTGIIGILLYKIIKGFLLDSVFITITTLFLGGLFLIAFEKSFKPRDDQTESIEDISYKQCLAIGLFQSIAIVPGISRSAATIIGGMYLGLKRKTIVEFSFLLAVPTMLAASTLELLKNYKNFSGGQIDFLAVGFVVSFAVALLSIKFLLGYIKKHNFIPFGIYRIIVALAFLFLS